MPSFSGVGLIKDREGTKMAPSGESAITGGCVGIEVEIEVEGVEIGVDWINCDDEVMVISRIGVIID